MLIFTFGIKIPCGLFVPCLALGAITGRIVGILMELISFKNPDFFLFESECQKSANCIEPGIYALVGACAFLGGATRMTLSLVVIIIELTSGLSLIVPLMVASFTAKIFGEFLCKGGIYDAHISLNGYPFLDNKTDFQFNSYAMDVMKPQYIFF
jgi:chloride channel 3/4/5